MTVTRPDALPTLGDAYALERELGGGGMSRVFVATEVALKRRVVVKVLGRELAEGLSAERFAREIALAAALQDPHIVPVHATGTTGEGLPYFTMPYIEGESLRERIARGPLALDEALRTLRDVAEALEYAHARGIVHRDIKPENILLSGRNAVVADFGIAKAVSAAREAGNATRGATLTSVGVSLGTPAYMSPEQAVGDPTDHRSDLYAWGMVAYELLAGSHPFAARTTTAQLMTAQLTETPRALDAVRPGLPPSLGALVMRCLAKSPDERPADAAAVLAALGGATTDLAITSGRRAPVAVATGGRGRALVGAGVVAVLALGGGALALRGGSDGDTGAPAATGVSTTPSLAVLPFEHQGDSADAYLTAGITDEIRNKLTGVSNLVVIARASSMQYTGRTTPPQQIAKELGVRWLLTGTVQVLGMGDQRRVLVRPELVEVTPDGRLQSKGGTPFDGPLGDVVKAQGEVASQVVGSMEVTVGGSDRARLVEVPTTNPEAYDLYLRALAATSGGANSDPQSLGRAAELLEAAVVRDSTMAAGWAALGATVSQLYGNGGATAANAARGREAVARALRLAPGAALSLRARGSYLRFVERDLRGALAALDGARRLAPGDERVVRAIANTKSELGLLDEALQDFDAAVALDPRSAANHISRSRFLLRLGRVAEARADADRARALAPTSLPIIHAQVASAVAAGDVAAARRIVVDASKDVPHDRVLAYLANYNELAWILTPADERLLLALGPASFVSPRAVPIARAQQYWWRGDTAAARAWGDSAVRAIDAELRESPTDPQLHLFRGLMFAHAGRVAPAMTAVREAIRISDANPQVRGSAINSYIHYVAARTATVVGDTAQALTWLREAVRRRGTQSPAWIRLDPSFAPIRGHPGFERVLAEAP